MKSKMVKCAFLGTILTSIYACNDKKVDSADVLIDKEQIKKDIQAREDEFAAQYNSGISKGIGYYSDDAISYFQNRPPLVGKEAIVAFLLSNIDSSGNKISFKTNEVFVSNEGNQVLEIGYFKVVDASNNAINTGNYMTLFERRDGKYVCIREMSASDTPVQ